MNYIIALPRSGTKFIAQVFNDLGIPSAHEVRNFSAKSQPVVKADWRAASRTFSSLDKVVHQVRNPLHVLQSLVTTSAIRGGFGRNEMSAIDIKLTGDSLLDSMQMYYNWNKVCESKTAFRYQIESIQPNSEQLKNLLTYLDLPVDQLHFNTSTNTNTRVSDSKYIDNITYDLLKSRSVEYCDLIYNMAKEYGYEA